MKKLISLLFFTITLSVFAQQSYYDDVDITKTGQALYLELQSKINIASPTFTYDDIKDAVKITDIDPTNANKVLLVYGYNDTDGNCITDRTRNKENFGGNNCEYNREHVFARSLANPSMGDVNSGSTGILADPHNLRPSDVEFNGMRGSKRFGNGSGNAGDVGSGNWYPGDEWKGDVARMMMYMYTRYGDRCLPSLVGVGTLQGDTQMLQMFLQWNVDDPVNAFEDQRNPYLQSVYGNRNPFIDNPYLATVIWGGPAAEDRWGILSIGEDLVQQFVVYPNPAQDFVWVQNATNAPMEIQLFDITGRKVIGLNFQNTENAIDVSQLNSGIYILNISSEGNSTSRKIVVQ